jgi:hypothetical protein
MHNAVHSDFWNDEQSNGKCFGGFGATLIQQKLDDPIKQLDKKFFEHVS